MIELSPTDDKLWAAPAKYKRKLDNMETRGECQDHTDHIYYLADRKSADERAGCTRYFGDSHRIATVLKTEESGEYEQLPDKTEVY